MKKENLKTAFLLLQKRFDLLKEIEFVRNSEFVKLECGEAQWRYSAKDSVIAREAINTILGILGEDLERLNMEIIDL
jgi:hypothetical protein